MQTIELYDETNAEQELAKDVSGIAASIKKWDKIAEALSAISYVMSQSCGLCCEQNRKGNAYCSKCILHVSDFNGNCCLELDEACKALDGLNTKVYALRKLLESKRRK